MRSVIQELQDDEAVLLMYLAGELPAGDRSQVERRLSAEDGLRVKLESLRALNEQVANSLGALDQVQPLPYTTTSSERKISRLMRQWQVDRLSNGNRNQVRRQSIFATLAPAYPFVAAASLFIGLIVWWGLRDEDQYPPAVATTQNVLVPAPAVAQHADPSGSDAFFGDLGESAAIADADDGLSEEENEIRVLASLSKVFDVE